MILSPKQRCEEPRSPERRGEERRSANAEQLVTGRRLRQQMHLGGEDWWVVEGGGGAVS